jgi:hypothetical protein
MNLRPIAAVGLALAVTTTGTGAALAVTGQFSSNGNSAAKSQYCPPGSQNGKGGQNGNNGNGKGKACGQRGSRPRGAQRGSSVCSLRPLSRAPRRAPANDRLCGKAFPGLVSFRTLDVRRDRNGSYRVFKMRFANGKQQTWRYHPSYNGRGDRWTKRS